jgi:hypothetical protein
MLLRGTGPLPHPAAHIVQYRWVAGWGSGPVQTCRKGEPK